jgi:predicted DNA-binding protein
MGKPKTRSVVSRVESEKREWIEREAQRRDRSISYVVRELITEGIERRESSDSTQ